MTEIPLERPYTAEFVEEQLRQAGGLRALRRVFQILGVILVGSFWRVIDAWSWTYRHGETREDRQRRRSRWLVDQIIQLGPAFVKIGQALSTRPDLLPLSYLQAFSRLQDKLPTFPNEVAFACIEEELGWKPWTLFDQFDMEPFAAASLGQVYYAVTHGGEEVAVKVQRPDLVEVISLDLALMRRFAEVAERFKKLSRGQPWVSIVDEFGRKLFEELDYVHEAHLAERFRENVEDVPGIYAPRVYRDLTSRRVITTELVRGIKITDVEELEAADVNIPFLLRQGVRANLKQLFEHGLFHADPHPGNLLVRPEDGTLVFIDFGMMGIIHPEQKMAILEIFIDVINQRPENLKDNLVALGCLRPDARWDELVPIANDLFRSLFGSAEHRYSFQDVTSSFAPLIYEYEFRIPVDFAYIVRAIMTLEGISLQLAPEFDIFAVSAPYAARMMLTFPDPSLRKRLLDELLTQDGSVNWKRLEDLAALAAHDTSFRLETEGLVEPALDMILSPEGAALRTALIADLLRAPQAASIRIEALAPLLSTDPSFSGREIIDRLVSFLLSPDGEETRRQLSTEIKTNGNGSFDLARVMDLLGMAGRLHPDFSTMNLARSLGSYLLSEKGRPTRNQLVEAGTLKLLEGLTGQLNRLARQPAPPRRRVVATGED